MIGKLVVYLICYFSLISAIYYDMLVIKRLSDRDLLIAEVDLRVQLKINRQDKKWTLAGAGACLSSKVGSILVFPAMIRYAFKSRDRYSIKRQLHNIKNEISQRKLVPLDVSLEGVGRKASAAGLVSAIVAGVLGSGLELPIQGAAGLLIGDAIQEKIGCGVFDSINDRFTFGKVMDSARQSVFPMIELTTFSYKEIPLEDTKTK